jgi:hypothetical protein
MNTLSSLLQVAIDLAEWPGDSVTSLVRTLGEATGLYGDSLDAGIGLMMSALAGVAAALAVSIGLIVYVRSGYRTVRDVVTLALAAAFVLGLLAFVTYDMRHAALAYLGINPSKPAVEFEIRLPTAALSAISDTQVELHTDRNQTLAKLDDAQAAEDGRSVLRGSVALDYRTIDRVVILNLPGRAVCEFRLRLPADPGRSDQFGPWHLADRVAPTDASAAPAGPLDGFAIRYRVL